jgi:hypothetical protein
MTVALHGDTIVLSGACGVEEAELLFTLIQGNPQAAVDLSEVGQVHTALWQVLLWLAPPLVEQPRDPFIRDWLMPNISGAGRTVLSI